MFDRKQQNSMKQLSFNQKIKKKRMYKIVTAAEEKKRVRRRKQRPRRQVQGACKWLGMGASLGFRRP